VKQLLHENSSRWRIPVTIVGGCAGAGKTTLLRHSLLHNDGRHIVVIVRDLNELQLDARLIRHLDGSRCVLHNGSVCLTAGNGIETTLLSLHSTLDAPEHVLVEAPSNVTSRRSSGYAFMPGFRPAGSVVVVSATMLRELTISDRTDPGMVEQLRGAELIVITQVDRVPPSSRASLRHALLSHVDGASFVEVSRGTLPLAMLVGIPSLTAYAHHATVDEWTPTYALSSHGRRIKAYEPQSDTDFRAWQLTTARLIERTSFRDWANALPFGVVRGDGVLQLRHDPTHRYRFTLCGARWWLEREGAWAGPRVSSISLVGLTGATSMTPARERVMPIPLTHEMLDGGPRSNGKRSTPKQHSQGERLIQRARSLS
jgi:G3E family GTPase